MRSLPDLPWRAQLRTARGGGGRSPLRLAFLGCRAATDAHARVLRATQPSTSLWCASRDGQGARAAMARHGGAGTFDGDAAALADPGIDAVVIATPPASHRELTLAALAAGKHVVVEKPAFPRLGDFDEVARAATAAERRVLVAENYPYKPLVGWLRSVVAGGTVGEPLVVAVSALKRQTAVGWRAERAQVGGGPLLEGGVHWISLTTSLGLTVRAVRATCAGSPEDSVILLFSYAEGAAGVLAFSWAAHSPLRGVRVARVVGTEGSAVFEANGAALAAWGRRCRLLVPDPRRLSGRRDMWRAFGAALEHGDDPPYALADARRDVELVHEAYAQLDGPSARPATRDAEGTRDAAPRPAGRGRR